MKEPTATLPCVLCARLLEQRADKNSKPYFVCEPCGTQFFIRGTVGRERLAEVFRSAKPLAKKDARKKDVAVIDGAALRHEVEQLQEYIETFCDGELVIPNGPLGIENAVAFPKWSGEVCNRISNAIDLLAKV